MHYLAAGVALNLRCFSGGLGEYPQKTQIWAIFGVPFLQHPPYKALRLKCDKPRYAMQKCLRSFNLWDRFSQFSQLTFGFAFGRQFIYLLHLPIDLSEFAFGIDFTTQLGFGIGTP